MRIDVITDFDINRGTNLERIGTESINIKLNIGINQEKVSYREKKMSIVLMAWVEKVHRSYFIFHGFIAWQ